ncbi:protein NEDD1 [Canna indica]|uniref:Protein NEDD1 n=1 Tax=Canna indica TaxID=4628 RepID=A0AAQ3KII4_9LILI|nr:protein NEDD1 [Canna indica]
MGNWELKGIVFISALLNRTSEIGVGMGFVDSSASLLATCGGDTVKLFDVTVEAGDPCTLTYTPSPGSQVNSVKWNHTDLVVASAGEDKKISLWHKNGQSMGSIPTGSDLVDDIEESISSITFSNKSSRYICSGGSGHIVKIWDLQRKRCIKRLSGHTDTITGVMYNCKDEHLASISLKGDLILHNLASGARAAELKDPNGQALRVLDYSRFSRHVLSIAGDDGSVHIWDTTGRSPKVSWLKQHSAPTTGICFSPSSEKIIVTVGLDKKLYMFDSGTRRPTSCMPFEAPFSSLAYNDDGNVLAAGTSNGRVVFYDVRGKPKPFTVLRAYSSSEAIINLCWQRSKPVIVNEKNCSDEIALLGGSNEESVLMPDPLPSVAVSKFSSITVMPSLRSSSTSVSGSISITPNLSTAEETPYKSHLWAGGTLPRLQALRSSYDLKDDMEVFSPLVDVQPITPSLASWWNDNDEVKKDKATTDKKSTLFSSSMRRYGLPEGSSDSHPISDWRSTASSRQDDNPPILPLAATNSTSKKSELSLSQSPGNALPEKSVNSSQPSSFSRLLSSMSFDSVPISTGFHDSSSSASFSKNSLVSPTVASLNLQNKAIFDDSNSSSYLGPSSVYHPASTFVPSGTKTIPSISNSDLQGTVLSSLPRRLLTPSERISTSSVFSEGVVSATSSPKSKKTGQETREELMNSLLSRQDASAPTVSASGNLPASSVVLPQPLWSPDQPADKQLGTSSFSLQLVQRTLEETLESVQKSIHEDVRNLHIELLRQFHMQEMEMSGLLKSILDKQDELVKEVQSLRRENQQLRQLL